MWFEILPSAGIIFAAFSVPGIGMYYMHKIFLGNPFRRDMGWIWNRNTYLRDRRLTDNPYKLNVGSKLLGPIFPPLNEVSDNLSE